MLAGWQQLTRCCPGGVSVGGIQRMSVGRLLLGPTEPSCGSTVHALASSLRMKRKLQLNGSSLRTTRFWQAEDTIQIGLCSSSTKIHGAGHHAARTSPWRLPTWQTARLRACLTFWTQG